MSTPGRGPRPVPAALLLLSVLLVAVNLRPAITSVGPVLPMIKDDTGLSASALGLLGAVPIIMFAVVSPGVHVLVHRFGVERTVAGALVVLGAGTLVRSWPGPTVNLWLGMALIGATVAVLNVTLPVVVKRDFPQSTARTTGLYVAGLSVFAALASGLAVPLAHSSALSWRLSLGAWVVLAAAALVVWVPRALAPRVATHPGDPAGATLAPSGSVWRSTLAWQLAAYMGLQSMAFYVVLTWLPTVEQDLGVPATEAGWHLFVLQVMGIVANLGAPLLMRVGRDETLGAVLPGVLIVVGMAGLMVLPELVLLWVAATGMGTGGAFVVALSLMGMRAEDPTTATRLSAMSQAVGYALAGTGLVVAGMLRDLFGPGPAVLVQVAVVGTALIVTAPLVGRDRVLRA